MKYFYLIFFSVFLLTECNTDPDSKKNQNSDSLSLVIKSHQYLFMRGDSYEFEFAITNVKISDVKDITLEVDSDNQGTLTEKNGVYKWTENFGLSKVGKHYFNGNLKFKLFNNKVELPVIDSFEVFEPSAVILSPNKFNNFLFKNIDNTLLISVAGFAQSDLQVTSTNSTLIKDEHFTYKIKPNNDSNVTVNISARYKNKYYPFATYIYKVTDESRIEKINK